MKKKPVKTNLSAIPLSSRFFAVKKALSAVKKTLSAVKEKLILLSHKIANSITDIAFNKEGLAEISVAGKSLCLAWHKEQLYAFAAACPHAGALLSDGYTDAVGNIVCAKHCYKFALSTGRNTSGEGYLLKTYTVNILPEGVFISL